jgi:hypothetical protein
MYSYLWKDSKLFRLGGHVSVALAAAHTMVMGYNNVIEVSWKPMTTEGARWMIIPLVLGVPLYARYWKGVAFWSRLPIAFTVGTGAALAIRGELNASVVQQVRATMVPLSSLDNILLVIGVAIVFLLHG